MKKPETPPPDDENKYTDYVDPKSKYAMATPTRPTPLNLFSEENMLELLDQGLTPFFLIQIIRHFFYLRESCNHACKELKDVDKITWIHRALDQENVYHVSNLFY